MFKTKRYEFQNHYFAQFQKEIKVYDDETDCKKYSIHYASLEGLIEKEKKKKPQRIREWVDYNTFREDWTDIPDGYKEVKKKYPKWWVTSFFCSREKSIELSKQNNPLLANVYKTVYGNEELNNNGNSNTYPNVKIYKIHDNGGRPFIVYIRNKKDIFVYQREDFNKESMYYIRESSLSTKTEKNYWAYTTLVYECLNAERIWIGKSKKCPMTEWCESYGPYYNGNSILVCEKDRTYVHIGIHIYRFETELGTFIEYFFSPVGNNDVPYPYAIDKTKRCLYPMGYDVLHFTKEIPDIDAPDYNPYNYVFQRKDDGSKLDLKKLGIMTIPTRNVQELVPRC